MNTLCRGRLRSGWRQLCLGCVLGLFGAALVLATVDVQPALSTMQRKVLLSDCDGQLKELVIHYIPEAGDIVGPTYRDFLAQLPRELTVHVVCRDDAALDDLVERVGPTRCSLRPVVVSHPITTWSRDRWLALSHADRACTTLLCPRAEKGQDIWPQRSGDAQVGGDLQAALQPRVVCRRSGLLFDGGDFVADERCVFVTPDVALRNVQQTVRDRRELVALLQYHFGREVVLLDDAPPYHAGMFMMTAGDDTVVVGDPGAAQQLLSCEGVDTETLCPPQGADFSPAMTAKFDAVAQACSAAGYRVVRIPVVPGRDGRTYLTYVNVVIDQRPGQRLVYMPVFNGVEALNQAAERVWSELGYEVRPVDCTRSSRYFGSLRCLVNVLSRRG